MKKIIIIVVFLSLSTYCFSENISKINSLFLSNYFNSEPFVKIDSILIDNKMFYIVGHNVNIQKSIFDRAIICSFDGAKVEIFLYINQQQIIDANGENLFSTSLDSYGWKLDLLDNETLTISYDFYHDNGKSVTDGPVIYWDKDTKKFENYTIDSSQY